MSKVLTVYVYVHVVDQFTTVTLNIESVIGSYIKTICLGVNVTEERLSISRGSLIWLTLKNRHGPTTK